MRHLGENDVRRHTATAPRPTPPDRGGARAADACRGRAAHAVPVRRAPPNPRAPAPSKQGRFGTGEAPGPRLTAEEASQGPSGARGGGRVGGELNSWSEAVPGEDLALGLDVVDPGVTSCPQPGEPGPLASRPAHTVRAKTTDAPPPARPTPYGRARPGEPLMIGAEKMSTPPTGATVAHAPGQPPHHRDRHTPTRPARQCDRRQGRHRLRQHLGRVSSVGPSPSSPSAATSPPAPVSCSSPSAAASLGGPGRHLPVSVRTARRQPYLPSALRADCVPLAGPPPLPRRRIRLSLLGAPFDARAVGLLASRCRTVEEESRPRSSPRFSLTITDNESGPPTRVSQWP